MPLNIFVKLIQFIASQRLEHSMSEIVLELLNMGRSKTIINPEVYIYSKAVQTYWFAVHPMQLLFSPVATPTIAVPTVLLLGIRC